jgi:L-aspartate oxidase
MRRTGTRFALLDMTALDAAFLKHRFPKIYETCKHFGLDITTDLLPVSPASHYCMGGIRTDLWGRSTLPGLYAAGEVSCTGVHGANRLASNSLLEGLVFGARAGAAALEDSPERRPAGRAAAAPVAYLPVRETAIGTAVRKRVKRIMWERVGILRDRSALERAVREFDQISEGSLGTSSRNFVTLAKLVATAALWREESRGAHYRSDFPETLESWHFHSVQRINSPISTAEHMNFDRSLAV